jgi:hypothetical protein
MTTLLTHWKSRALVLTIAVERLRYRFVQLAPKTSWSVSMKQGPRPEEEAPDGQRQAALQKNSDAAPEVRSWGEARPTDQSKAAKKPN